MPGTNGLADKFSVWLARSVGASASLHDVYDVDADGLLGIGSFGKVMRGINKATSQPCAIKQIAKSVPFNRAAEEIQIMQKLEHQHIVRFFEHFEDNLNKYIVMELCAGGKLVNFLARMQDYRESDAALVMSQLFSAIKYIHEKHIVHRDVKPDNMLLESWNPLRSNTLKLIDFGLSCKCTPGQEVRLNAGTPEFISPQAINGRYDTQADLWSCGVSLYFLLCGYVPFRAETDAGVCAAVERGNFSFAGTEWRNISDNAKDLIRTLLTMSPSDRSTAEQALNHTWVAHRASEADGSLEKAGYNFRAYGTRRKRPQQEANVFPDFRAVVDEVTKWTNSLFPDMKLLGQCASGPQGIYVSEVL